MEPVLADFSLAKIYDHSLVGTTHTPSIGTCTYRAPEVVEEVGYGLPSDVYSCGIVILELFNGLMTIEKDKQALKHVQELVGKMGKKPLPTLLKGLLRSEAKERLTAKASLQEPLFEKLPMPEIARLIDKSTTVHCDKENDASAAAKKKKGKKDPLEVELSKYATKYEFTNPLTLLAAKIYHERTGADIEYCAILASKLYESILINLWDCQNLYEDFNLQKYVEAEKEIFKGMDYCLFV
tara:strand:+ start:934 stop:1650 length:717 start_codon:yes stop_codon:yes gene_type:complete